MNAIVTTIQKPTDKLLKLGLDTADTLKVPFCKRDNLSLKKLSIENKSDVIVVITQTGPIVHTEGGEYFFHLNMSELRIKNLLNGKPDHMVSAMDLHSGMSVLDCTLGLGTDAIVASFVVGTAGKIVGLEASPIIAYITRFGLKNHKTNTTLLNEALQRIYVRNSNYNQALYQIPENSFDIVFFDPMFRQPIHASSSLKPLRYLADHSPLDQKALKQAYRIAKKRVVVKESIGSSEFLRLGIDKVKGGKYSRVSYGILEKGN